MICCLMIFWFVFLNLVSIQESSPIVFRDDVSTFGQSSTSRQTSGRRISSRHDDQQPLQTDNERSATTELVRWPSKKASYNSSADSRVPYADNENRNNNPDQETDQVAINRKNKPIIFPKKSNPPRPKVLLPDITSNGIPVCVNSPSDTYCEKVDSYPRIDLRQEYGLDVEEFRDMFGANELKGIDARKSYTDDDYFGERICDGVRKIIYPKMAKNENKRWVYIVNDEAEFRQHVVTEICGRTGSSCAYLEGNLPQGVTSQCRQKHAYVRLLALHPTEQRTYTDLFQFPSCCTCYIKNPFYGQNINKSESQ